MAQAHSPLDQFKIKPLAELEFAGLDASFTNSSVWMLLILVALTVFLVGGARKGSMVPGRWQTMVELAYEFIAGMVRDNVGRDGKAFFPFIFTTFMFVLGANLAGMIPYSFTVTSHITVTFALAALIFIGVTLVGFFKHGFGYLKLFAPSGVPIALMPLIIVIEIISYLVRPVSLSVRLFANMLAGHMMLKIFAGFIVALLSAGSILSAAAILPFIINVLLTGLELLVAFLQAFVFAILSCVYLHDALHPEH